MFNEVQVQNKSAFPDPKIMTSDFDMDDSMPLDLHVTILGDSRPPFPQSYVRKHQSRSFNRPFFQPEIEAKRSSRKYTLGKRKARIPPKYFFRQVGGYGWRRPYESNLS